MFTKGELLEGEPRRIFVNRGKFVGKFFDDLQASPLTDDAISKVCRGMPMASNNRGAELASFLRCVDNNELLISKMHSHMKMRKLCHIVGANCRLGRKVKRNQALETIVADDLSASMMNRPHFGGYEIAM